MCLSCCSFIVCLCAVLFVRYTKILIVLALLSRTAWCNIVTPSLHNSCVRFPYSFKTSTDEFVPDKNRLKPLSPDNFFQYYILYRRIQAAEMKLLRPLAGCTLHDHKTKDLFNVLSFTGKHSVYCGLLCDSMELSVWLQRFLITCCFLFSVPDPEDVAFHLPDYFVPQSSHH